MLNCPHSFYKQYTGQSYVQQSSGYEVLATKCYEPLRFFFRHKQVSTLYDLKTIKYSMVYILRMAYIKTQNPDVTTEADIITKKFYASFGL